VKEKRVSITKGITAQQKESAPSERGASVAKTIAVIKSLGFTHVLMIPDSESALLYQAIGDDPVIQLITPCREGESIAIAAGLWTGGCKPLVVIQTTGLMEAGDALRGCGLGPKVPLRIMVGWRGYGGAQAGRMPIDSAYTYTEPLLHAWGIPYWCIMGDEDLPMLQRMDRTAAETSFPAAVVTGYAFRP
jgi:sulfopyruvate decarboxylase subunit alpha